LPGEPVVRDPRGVRGRRYLLAGAVAVAACGDNIEDPFYGLVRITGVSPFAAACDAGDGQVFPGSEVEPSLAIDPRDPAHLIAAWQQDRWSNGGARGIGAAMSRDGGRTWTASRPPFAACSGGSGPGTDYERASDPWVTFAADGTPFLGALVFDNTRPRSAMVASRSADGGLSWTAASVLIADDNRDVFNDKNSITGDPTDPGRVYAVWDRVTGATVPTLPVGTGPVLLARTTDGVWEPSRSVFDPGPDNQTIGNVIVVLPDGTLVDVFNLMTGVSKLAAVINTATAIRSTDHGLTWSAPITIARMRAFGVRDPGNDEFIRSGTALPQVAVDRGSGALYVVWEAADDTGLDGIVLSRSVDGGVTWSAPRQVNGVPRVAAFTPGVAVAADGTVGVSYYDLRDLDRSDSSVFHAGAWLATSRDGGQTWRDEPLGASFDMRPSSLGTLYFLCGYQGLVGAPGGFIPVFVGATTWTDDHTDVFARPLP
jgi:hypothetical protein